MKIVTLRIDRNVAEVMVAIMIGVNVWQTLRLEKAVSFCTEFVEIMKG